MTMRRMRTRSPAVTAPAMIPVEPVPELLCITEYVYVSEKAPGPASFSAWIYVNTNKSADTCTAGKVKIRGKLTSHLSIDFLGIFSTSYFNK